MQIVSLRHVYLVWLRVGFSPGTLPSPPHCRFHPTAVSTPLPSPPHCHLHPTAISTPLPSPPHCRLPRCHLPSPIGYPTPGRAQAEGGGRGLDPNGFGARPAHSIFRVVGTSALTCLPLPERQVSESATSTIVPTFLEAAEGGAEVRQRSSYSATANIPTATCIRLQLRVATRNGLR